MTQQQPASADKRLFLIDASNVLYRYFHAMRDHQKLNDNGHDISMASGVLSFLGKILENYRPEALAWVEDAGDSGRGALDERYKTGRKRLENADKERMRTASLIVKDVLLGLRIPVLRVDGFEADDVMATMAVRVAARGWTAVIVGYDKDMYQLVSEKIHILVPGRGGKPPVPDKLVTPETAKERLGVPADQVVDYLSLVGDGADTVSGVKGIGEKGAVSLLRKFGSLDGMLERLEEVEPKKYREALRTYAADARLSQQLIRLRLDVDIPAGRDLRIQCRDEDAYQAACQKHGLHIRPQPEWIAQNKPGMKTPVSKGDEAAPKSEPKEKKSQMSLL